MSDERRVSPNDLKVLLVDDDDSMHETLELFLANKPFYHSDIIASLEKAKKMIDAIHAVDGVRIKFS